MPSRRARSARTLHRSVALSAAAVTAVGLLGACSVIEGDGSTASKDAGAGDRKVSSDSGDRGQGRRAHLRAAPVAERA